MKFIKRAENLQRLEALYGAKWQEIWKMDRDSDVYKKLEDIVYSCPRKPRYEYGHFWKVKK